MACPFRLILTLAFFSATFVVQAMDVTNLTVVAWNVENLFDAVANQPEKADEEFTPTSWRRWTPERYSKKLQNLAWVIDKMKPDVLCMAEVENKGVVQALVDTLKKNYGWTLPYIAHADTPDPRGIDMAIISRYPIQSFRYVPHGLRRGMLVATIEVDGSTLTLIQNHLKSQMGDRDENITIRTSEALALRNEALGILRKKPNTSLVITGDFNEDIDGPCITQALKALPKREVVQNTSGDQMAFYNLIGDIPEKARGSYYYARRKVWNTFDCIIVPPPMLLPLDKPGPEWRVLGADSNVTKTFVLPEMREADDGRPKAFRRVRIKDKPANYYVEGYADHFPVMTVLERAHLPAPTK